MASFEDAADDVAYAPPFGPEFTDGDFDLRRFRVLTDGDDAVFEVTFAAPVRRPDITQRMQSSPIELTNGIYLQNVDIYIDTDRAQTGYVACIPGRRVAFADGRTWKSAIVLTPQPALTAPLVRDALGPAGAQVFFPAVTSAGRTATARVPWAQLGGRPSVSWAYAVMVSGAAWEKGFDALDRVRGKHVPDAFTLPVMPVVEEWAFGGGSQTGLHPQVVDVLLPPGVDQRAVLQSYDVDAGTFARVPFVQAGEARRPSPLPPAPALDLQAHAKPPAGLVVADVAGDMISVTGPVAGLRTMQFGWVLDSSGKQVARVVIVRLLENGLVASAVDGVGGGNIARGARVQFGDAPRGQKEGP